VEQPDQALAVGMQEAEVAGTAKTFWQDMLEDQPQKRCPGNRPELGQLALGVLIAEGHQPAKLCFASIPYVLLGDCWPGQAVGFVVAPPVDLPSGRVQQAAAEVIERLQLTVPASAFGRTTLPS